MSRLVVQGSSVDTQTSSVSSHPQTTNQAVGNDHRVPGKTQVLPYPIKSSSALSTKARIAEDMAKGPAFHGQSKYKGMRIPKKVNPPGESRSPVISPTTNPQSPLDWSQRAPLLRFSNEHNDQSQIMEAPSQQHPPPSPPSRPEEPSHDIEPDRMDVDQLECVRSPYCCHFSNLRQPALHLLFSSRKILEQRRIYYTR